MLTLPQKKSLESKLRGFNDSTGYALVIITHVSLKDAPSGKLYTVEEAALHYANSWGIGDKKKNNGVLIFLAKNDRKVRIATGKGVTEILTDEECQHIIDDDIVPAFKAGDYYRGLDDASTAIMVELSPGTYSRENETNPVQYAGSNTGSITEYSMKPEPDYSNAVMPVLLVGMGALLLYGIFRRMVFGRANFSSGIYSRSGYHNYNQHHHPNDTWSTPGSSSSDTSSHSSFSSDSASSGDSSSSGSSSSSSSDGGGASGSW